MSTGTPLTPAEQTVQPHQRALPVFDPLLLLAGIGLVGCSYLMLRTAVGSSEAERQAMYGGVGVLLALVISRIDYSRLREYKLGLYALLIVLDLAVYAFPPIANARRWIPLPGFSFQSSEFGKLLLIVALAGFAVDRSRQLHERRTTARIMLLTLVAALLVIPEPDLGTGLVYVAIGFAILFFAGTSWKHLTGLVALFAAALVLALAVAPSLGVHVVHQYQMQRLTAFLDPSRHDTSSYQLRQAQIAIGSGQKTGQGHQATQSALGFLPEPDTDFAFASVAEIYGFVGGAVVLALYALLMWRALRRDHRLQEPVRDADRGRDPGDVDVPGVRQRRNDRRDCADHRGAAAADQLRRFVGDHHVRGDRAARIDLHPGQVGGVGKEPRASFLGIGSVRPRYGRSPTSFQKD